MNILVAHDGSPFSDKALDRAIEIIKTCPGELTIISVIPDLCLPDGELSGAECEKMTKAFDAHYRTALEKSAARAVFAGLKPMQVVEHGEPVDMILALADAKSADLIVIGSRGLHGAKRLFLGSVSSKVVEHAKCDVLVVK